MKKEEKKRWLREFGLFSGIGIEFAVSVLLGSLFGYWLDGKLGTSPWLLIIGFLLGTLAGFKNFYQLVKKLFSDNKG